MTLSGLLNNAIEKSYAENVLIPLLVDDPLWDIRSVRH